MSDELVISELPLTVSAATVDIVAPFDVKVRAPGSELLAPRFAGGIFRIGATIALAGAVYPVAFALVYLITVMTIFLIVGGDLNTIRDVFGIIALGCTLGVGIGLVWASMACIIVLPFVYFFVRSLALRGGIVRLAAFSGGLVGFVAVLPLFLMVLFEAHQEWWQTAITVLLGPALATVLGQIGGARGGRHVERNERAIARATVNADGQSVETRGDASNRGGQVDTATFQFGVWHLLVISAWLSLLLTIVRLCGLDYLFVALLLFGWLAYQAVTLCVGGLLTSWFVRPRVRRQSRST